MQPAVGRPGNVHALDIGLGEAIQRLQLVSVQNAVVHAANIANVMSRPRQTRASSEKEIKPKFIVGMDGQTNGRTNERTNERTEDTMVMSKITSTVCA